MARTPSDSLGDIREKLKVLQGLMQKGRWFDGRDFQLLDSIPRDVRKDYASEVARIGAVICRQTKVLNSTEDAQARSMSIFEADELFRVIWGSLVSIGHRVNSTRPLV